MKITTIKQFKDREELDNYIKTTHGENPDNNKDILIEDIQENLQALSLDEHKSIHGVKVKLIAKI